MKKMMLLALAAASVAMFALPAVASAGAPVVDCGASCKFSVHGGTSVLSRSDNLTVTCTANTGTGEFEAGGTTGKLQLTFTGCKESVFNSSCNTTGSASGTIVTTPLTFHTAYLTDAKTTPGVLVTSNANHFSTFKCFGGFVTTEVTGNGVLGHLSSPACNGSSSAYKLKFEATAHGQQKYKQVTATGTVFDLTSNGNTSAMNAEGTVTFPAAAQLTCV
jgi:hypothetical protein